MKSLVLLDVIKAVGEHAETSNELKVVVAHLINSGKVKLNGDLAGCKVDCRPNADRQAVVVGFQTTLPQQKLDEAG